MPNHTPTEEQSAILGALSKPGPNLLITARAGAAKTSTIEMAIRERSAPCTYLAFNRTTVLEAKERVPDDCDVLTLNGLGHRAWGRFLRTRLDLQKNKLYALLTEAEYEGEHFSEMLRACRLSKQLGFVPEGQYDMKVKPLCNEQEFFDQIDMKFSDKERDLIVRVLRQSMKMALRGVIDFDDQILCAALFPIAFDRKGDIVFVDEAQDLSPINHTMIKRAFFGARIVAVGDQAQAIYGFRGASANGMERLREMFRMEELKLTMTFRCASAIVDHANWRVGDMRAFRSGGEISRHGPSWNLSDVPEGSAILCRNNAPILRLAVRALREGYAPHVQGRDLFAEMSSILRKIGKNVQKSKELLPRISDWEQKQLEVWRSDQIVRDKADCLRLMCEQADTVAGVLSYIRNLSERRSGSFTLSTCHRAKGMEWDRVFIMDKHLLDLSSEQSQDRNLLYVAQTRARDHLSYIDS